MSLKRRPSLLGALLWVGFGILFLLQNFGAGIDFWSLASRYWPLLLILLGLGKIIEYFLKKDAVSVSIGEIIGILFLLMIGSALTKISNTHFVEVFKEFPIQIGGVSVRPGQWMGESHSYTEEAAATRLSGDSSPILIENSYGSVSVIPGSDREVRARLKKVIYANESRAKDIATEVRLEIKLENKLEPAASVKPEAEPLKKNSASYFVVRTNRESLNSKEYTFNTDLEVIVPKNSQVQIRNTFGDVRVGGISGKLDINATHRSLHVSDCSGEFNISTRFAESRLTNLVGNIRLDSRSRGRVYIENIKGDLSITSEYSPLEVINVDGRVQLSNTEGSIRVESVTKPVVIVSRGAAVQVKNLQDSLKLDASHKNVEIEDVSSDVAVESRYATVALTRIKGNVDIRSNSDDISADDIRGSLKLKGTGSEVRVHGISGPLDIQTTLKDVVINDFSDSCTVSSEYADISVSSRNLAKGDIKLQNSNGDVTLYLPKKASFVIDAAAKNGRVESNYSELALSEEKDVRELKTKVNNGGPKLLLETSNGNIRIHPVQDLEED
jgi:DUF4097 and DUF4098 domain-containing protein YvlB